MRLPKRHLFKIRDPIVAPFTVLLAITLSGCSPEISSRTNSTEQTIEQTVDVFASDQGNDGARKKVTVIQTSASPTKKKNHQTYTAAQLKTKNTLLVLAFDPVSRAEYIMHPYRTLLAKEQIEACENLAGRYERDFDRLYESRTKLLANGKESTQFEVDPIIWTTGGQFLDRR